MQPAKFTGIAKNGEFQADYPEQRQAWLMCCDGKPLQEAFGPPETDQSAEQRGYYWGVICTKAGEYLGDTKEGVDFDLRKTLLSVDRGNGKKRIRSTSELNRRRYSRYIDDVIILLAKAGYAVEPPNRNWNTTGWYVR
jgi:hypothetical protein